MDYSFAMPTALDAQIELGDWPNWFKRHARVIESGVASVGEPAAYALVWEWGNLRQTKKGPRTVYGNNPAGQGAWLSSQASEGWIAVNEPAMWEAVDDWLDTFDLEGNTESAVTQELERVSLGISSSFVKLLKGTVPIDSGDLENSLQVVPPGDSLLDVIEDSFSEMEGNVTDSGILLIDKSFDSPLYG